MTQIDSAELERLTRMLSLLNEQSQPNVNALSEALRDLPVISLNIKAMGYELARSLARALPRRGDVPAQHVGLRSKASTQVDMESDWVGHWCSELQVPLLFHRKLWELSYVLQAVHENGHLRPGARGLGFGCGVEPIPSYLASRGLHVTITDQEPDQAAASGWAASNQHTGTLAAAHHSHLVSREAFNTQVDLRYVDMNDIPANLVDYDFCWSVCALEHLGSIANGVGFIENSLAALRPGGLAVHTTELNINPAGPTIDNWPTVLFQKHHLLDLAERLRAAGHHVAEFDFSLGDKPLDRFIDLPPYHHDLPPELAEWIGPPEHLKLSIDGFVSTCFGLVIVKAA